MNGFDLNGPLNFTAESLAQEASSTQAKLQAGLGTLRDVDDVTYGATAKDEVWRDGKVVLYRFRGAHAPSAKVPLLICYALVNRPYMVDLQADKSIVRGLLERGEDVYVLDWGYPDRSDRYLELEDYIQRFLGGAVDHLRRTFGLDAINLLGICQGGAFSLCYSALNPAKVRNLITMVTPVDFHTDDNMLGNWTRGLDVDLFVDTLGNVPADLMNMTYLTLKPWRLFVQKYVGMVDILDNKAALEDFLRMEKWIFDSPDQAGEAFRQFVKQFYQSNGFVNGGIDIGGREVHLGDVAMPVLNIFAEQDHLVPPAASKALAGLVGTDDYSELSFKGGHIGIYVSGRAQREVPSAIHDWLAQRAR
ncbi:class III poly(R)-hydroxyalkanoic acid synthase subunit PhaC [Lysobacter koreensis]|uniref:Poly(3-hydroxyalkanoate) polymerase subunit PhaC n=1 Tax=Lysobacter koreensis TaxID=266122 RepID=A0ABW2YI11_9GAMM